MPKSKKRKTNHHKATGPNGELTHEEIWDDSALIRSWNEAVEEYEFYHSIHAKGEDLDEILRQAEAEENEEALPPDTNLSSSTALELISEPVLDDGNIEDVEFNADVTVIHDDGSKNVNQPELADHVLQSHPASALEAQDSLQSSKSTSTAINAHSSIPQPEQQQHSSTALPLPSPSTDQSLENIKMAYYWAGYYSGLYDGQLQQQQSQQSQQNNNAHPESSQQPI